MVWKDCCIPSLGGASAPCYWLEYSEKNGTVWLKGYGTQHGHVRPELYGSVHGADHPPGRGKAAGASAAPCTGALRFMSFVEWLMRLVEIVPEADGQCFIIRVRHVQDEDPCPKQSCAVEAERVACLECTGFACGLR